jgi:O-antigen/teichoic acid export membrane protein
LLKYKAVELKEKNMLNTTSVKTRFFVSVGGNVSRAVISFIGGLLVARGLSPSGYGNLMFLLGSFTSFKSLMDLGTSSAFYTFLSQRSRNRRFYLVYFGWLGAQFLGTSLLIILILPQILVNEVWLGHSRNVILLAFAASFFQQQVWQTIGQIGDASRKTVKIQIMNIVVGTVHLAVVATLLALDWISVNSVLWLFAVEYFVVIIWAYWFLKDSNVNSSEESCDNDTFKQLAKDYWAYCKPLVALSLVSFAYDFADRWMLQKFGGSNQQGFFQISSQFATISLLATTSILRVFWKEIAEASACQNEARIAYLYHKVTRSLVMFSAILSGFLIPWSEQIVKLFLGNDYALAWPVLAVMFLYPIHQSLGQIGGTMFLATGRTRTYMLVSMMLGLVSIPATYLIQAPVSNPVLPGLGLGAFGMALKMVILGIVSVNIQAWLVARYHNWKFDWLYQVVGIVSVVGIGYLAKLVVGLFWDLSHSTGVLSLSGPILMAGVLYLPAVAGLIWLMPWLTGMERNEIKDIFGNWRGR